VLGNHEQNASAYFRLFHLPGNERWYSFDSGPVHLNVLDLYSPFQAGSEQYEWLEADLQSTKQPWRIVSMHDSPYVYSSRHLVSADALTYLAPIFEKYRVSLVIVGHNHFYQRLQVKGVSYIVTGGGGAPLYDPTQGPGVQYSEATYHYISVVADSSTLTTEGIRLDGTRFDAATLTRDIDDQVKDGPSASSFKSPESPALAQVGMYQDNQSPSGWAEGVMCSRCHLPSGRNEIQVVNSMWQGHPRAVAGLGAASLLVIILGRQFILTKG